MPILALLDFSDVGSVAFFVELVGGPKREGK